MTEEHSTNRKNRSRRQQINANSTQKKTAHFCSTAGEDRYFIAFIFLTVEWRKKSSFYFIISTFSPAVNDV
jgi:hypothetical protein